MAAKKKQLHSATSAKKTLPQAPAWKRLLLALTLLPLAAGVLMIIAWAIDIEIWQPPDVQVTVAVSLMFLSFSASNLLQANWLAGAGWGLLSVSDLLLLGQNRPNLLVIALALGAIGLLLLLAEIFRRVRRSRA